MSIRLYVGNLPKEEVDRSELQAVFAEAGESISTKVIKDRKTGKCRGFGFVTVKDDEQADQIIEKFNGHLFKDSPLKIEKALPRSKGQQAEEEGNTAPPPPPPNKASTGSNSGGGGNRRGSNKKNRRGDRSSTSTQVSSSEAVQPDPRWAQELEKLKQLLANQTTTP